MVIIREPSVSRVAISFEVFLYRCMLYILEKLKYNCYERSSGLDVLFHIPSATSTPLTLPVQIFPASYSSSQHILALMP